MTRAARQAVPGIHPGRQLDDAQIRRHRSRPCHHRPRSAASWAARLTSRASPASARPSPCGCRPTDPGYRTPRRQDRIRSAGRAPARTNRVLVIDDDATVRDLMRRYLKSRGVRRGHRGGGLEGLALARELRPSVITLDVLMPDMDGWSVLHAIREDAELSSIPVVMLTISDEKQQGFALGASAYLTKPVDRARLAAAARPLQEPGGNAARARRRGRANARELMRRLLVGEGWGVTGSQRPRSA